jgi:hypothetical protein
MQKTLRFFAWFFFVSGFLTLFGGNVSGWQIRWLISGVLFIVLGVVICKK